MPSKQGKQRKSGLRGRGARLGIIAMLAAGVVFALSACGGGASSESSSSGTLKAALSSEPAPLDPDTYYEAIGLPLMTAMYEGLVTYAPNSPKIEPQLATSWNISPDGKTYEFSLRKGVQFSDGSSFDAASAQASFQRRIDLEGGPSYMLEAVKSMETKGSDTFIVHLEHPVAPFMDYLASPYGPVMTSPKAVSEHEVKEDHAAAWIGSHSAGTGPYMIENIKKGSSYTLTENPHYWGEAPHFKTVSFAIIPSLSSQRLELESGELDLIFSGLSYRDLHSLSSKENVQVQAFPALFKMAVWVNPASSVFGPAKMRSALRAYLDNTKITEEIYGGEFATPSTQVYPNMMLPENAAPDRPKYEPAQLEKALGNMQGKSVTVGFYQGENDSELLAEHLQVQFEELGLKANTRAYPPSVLFGLPENPSQRPDLMPATFNPDAVAPDTYARIYWFKEAPVNLLGCTAPKGDELLDKAAAKPTSEASEPLSAQAGEAYRASNCWLGIADVKDTIAASSRLTGFEHELPWVFDVRLSTLEE